MSTDVRRMEEEAKALIDEAKSPATRRAYRSAWAAFESWCQSVGRASLPATPATVAMYLAHLVEARKKVSTIAKALAAISHAHWVSHLPSPRRSPEVKEAMSGARRRIGVAPVKKTAAVMPLLERMVDTCGADLRGARDRAILLLGFAGGFRRSELVSLDVEDIESDARGLRVRLRRSKTDQEGAGTTVGVPSQRGKYCPVAATNDWIECACLEGGPVFRAIDRWDHISDTRLTPGVVATLVKSYCVRVGLDPAVFAAHSLRSGMITTAAMNKRSDRSIMKQSRHKDVKTFYGYIQDATVFDDNALTGLMEER